jgi:hypothetical protein
VLSTATRKCIMQRYDITCPWLDIKGHGPPIGVQERGCGCESKDERRGRVAKLVGRISLGNISTSAEMNRPLFRDSLNFLSPPHIEYCDLHPRTCGTNYHMYNKCIPRLLGKSASRAPVLTALSAVEATLHTKACATSFRSLVLVTGISFYMAASF